MRIPENLLGGRFRQSISMRGHALIRLRNLLVHRYWTIDDERIYASVKSNFESVRNFLKRLREHVE